MMTATMADVTSSRVPPHAAQWEKKQPVFVSQQKVKDSHLNREISADILI